MQTVWEYPLLNQKAFSKTIDKYNLYISELKFSTNCKNNFSIILKKAKSFDINLKENYNLLMISNLSVIEDIKSSIKSMIYLLNSLADYFKSF